MQQNVNKIKTYFFYKYEIIEESIGVLLRKKLNILFKFNGLSLIFEKKNQQLSAIFYLA